MMIMMWSSSVIAALCFIIGLAIVSFTHYWYRWSNPKCNGGGRLPPGSMGFPLIGESIQFFIPTRSLDMPHFFKNRIARYGKVFRTSLAGRPVVVSSDPELNNYIFQQEGKLVELWYMDSFSKLIGQNSDNTSVGYIHKYIRNMVFDHFGTEHLKQNLFSKMELMANQYLQSWSTQPSVELKQSIATMMIELSGKELFSYDPSSSSVNLRDMFTDFFQGFVALPLNIPGTTYHRCLENRKKAAKVIEEILHERLVDWSPEKQRNGDLLDDFVNDMKKEEFLTEEFVVTLIFCLLLAGFESISSSLTVAVALLTDHPSVVKELSEEHEAILRNRENVDSPLTWKEYKSMTFTSQVINEIIRMSNVAPGMIRKVIKDIHINGYVIPEGWAIMVVPSAIHMNPDIFEDPLNFNPARWKNPGSKMVKSFMPFGGNMRNCAGAEFAKMSMAVFLHVLLTKFSWMKMKGVYMSRNPVLGFGDGLHVKISKKSECEANKP